MGQQAARTTSQVRQTGKGLKQGTKRFGEAVWGPFVKLSGVLWLELTGVFFGIFAVFAAGGVWKMRGEWRQTAANHDARTRSDRGRCDGGAVWVLLREQLCEGEAQGT